MKKLIVLALAVAMLTVGGTAQAAQMWDDMSWWGNTDATPEPVQDPTRAGYWWWPTTAASNADDQELWGNRGIVYHMWEPPAPAPAPEPPAPAPAPEPTWTKPVLNNVLFEFDSSELSAKGKAEIDKLADHMKKWPKTTVKVVGHTCNIGTDAYNMGLGERRADSVASYLKQQGIKDGRISTVSKGESDPAVPNTSPQNRAQNRRVVFHVNMPQ
ncbi:MAG: OmpA family protein [Candidatus Hydrogenedentota bacterium]